MKDYQSMLECALVRAEADEDISRYKKIKDDLKKVEEEISANERYCRHSDSITELIEFLKAIQK